MSIVAIEDLKKVIALSDLPDEHLQWILDHSDIHELEDGAPIAKFGEPAELMWFAIEGKVTFYMDINGHQVHYFTFENNDLTGGVGGMMP
jgi:CRP-like cAMP-binding protein